MNILTALVLTTVKEEERLNLRSLSIKYGFGSDFRKIVSHFCTTTHLDYQDFLAFYEEDKKNRQNFALESSLCAWVVYSGIEQMLDVYYDR